MNLFHIIRIIAACLQKCNCNFTEMHPYCCTNLNNNLILHLVIANFEMDCINTQPGSTNGDKPKWDVIETTLSTMYGILLVSIYAAFQYTELVKFPSFYHWLEINGFFIYLYVISIIYFLYLLIFVLSGTNKNRKSGNGPRSGPIKVVENEEVGLNCMMLLMIR